MPSLIKYPSGIYYIVYSVSGKRVWRSLCTKDKNLAYSRYLECERTGVIPRYSDPNEQLPVEETQTKVATLQAAIDDYLLYVKANFSQSTYRDYSSIMRSLAAFLGPQMAIDRISVRELERFKNHKVAGSRSPHSVNYNLRCIKAFFNLLVRWELLEQSPCASVRPLRIDDTIRPYFSRTDLQVLLKATIGVPIHDIILLAVLTGLRLGEIVHLQWDDINLDQKKIIVRSNGTFRTKSGKIRVIPISGALEDMLRDRADKVGYAFKDENGRPWLPNFVSKKFKEVVRHCNLDPKLHFHSLRHTFGSYLVEQGVSLYHVQQLMGHSSPSVTQIYAHLGNPELLQSVEKLKIDIGEKEAKYAPR